MVRVAKKYVVDTDIFINIKGHPNFDENWKRIVDLIVAGNLKTVEQVFCELKKFKGVLALLDKQRANVKIDSSKLYEKRVTNVIADIEKISPKLIDFTAIGVCESADPWLIAIAAVHDFTVVTAEKKKGAGSKNRIPFACKSLGVRCIGLIEFLSEIKVNN